MTLRELIAKLQKLIAKLQAIEEQDAEVTTTEFDIQIEDFVFGTGSPKGTLVSELPEYRRLKIYTESDPERLLAPP
jgi:hypothetical protein